MRIPRIKSVKKAVEIYYQNLTLGNKQIKELFGCGNDKVSELKKAARARMIEEDIPSYNGTEVNTITAYRAWGIDINELRNRYSEGKQILGK